MKCVQIQTMQIQAVRNRSDLFSQSFGINLTRSQSFGVDLDRSRHHSFVAGIIATQVYDTLGSMVRGSRNHSDHSCVLLPLQPTSRGMQIPGSRTPHFILVLLSILVLARLYQCMTYVLLKLSQKSISNRCS
jgi:hypothetical protein